MSDDRSSRGPLPEVLTRLLATPGSPIIPTQADRPRRPPPEPLRRGGGNRIAAGVWLWALTFNVAGFAILVTLWRSMG